jgi:hypothetical protein
MSSESAWGRKPPLSKSGDSKFLATENKDEPAKIPASVDEVANSILSQVEGLAFVHQEKVKAGLRRLYGDNFSEQTYNLAIDKLLVEGVLNAEAFELQMIMPLSRSSKGPKLDPARPFYGLPVGGQTKAKEYPS